MTRNPGSLWCRLRRGRLYLGFEYGSQLIKKLLKVNEAICLIGSFVVMKHSRHGKSFLLVSEWLFLVLLGIQLHCDEVIGYHGIFCLKRQAKSHLDHADSTFYRFSSLDKLLMGPDRFGDWLGYFCGKVGSQLGLDLGELVLEDNLDVPPSESLYRIQRSLLLPGRSGPSGDSGSCLRNVCPESH